MSHRSSQGGVMNRIIKQPAALMPRVVNMQLKEGCPPSVMFPPKAPAAAAFRVTAPAATVTVVMAVATMVRVMAAAATWITVRTTWLICWRFLG